jgi:hypothetical protein
MPERLSIICGNLRNLPKPALEYLVLKLNTLQPDVEFQFLPVKYLPAYQTSKLGGILQEKDTDLTKFLASVNGFVKVCEAELDDLAENAGRKKESIGRLIIISLAKNENSWYHCYEERFSAIFLGDWEETMAPPSLLEFILSLTIMEGLYCLMPERAKEITHIGTRGCIGDFNTTLEDVRYKILNGFLCSDCRNIIVEVLGNEKTDLWQSLLKKEWLGLLNNPLSTASIVSKLGYNLFLTKGYAPKFWEKTKNILSEDGIKELIKLLTLIAGAAVLVWLGLKKPG